MVSTGAWRRRRLLGCSVLAWALALARVSLARVVYLSPSGHDTNACGQSPLSACASLSYVLTTIAQPNDDVELASGTYVETASTLVFGDAAIQNLTIRSATGDAADVTIDRAYSGRLLDFTGTDASWFVAFNGLRFVRGGWTDPTPGLDYAGALMRLAAANAKISFTNCRFEANLNPKSGHAGRGGVGAITAGSPNFIDCIFSDNWGGVAGTFYVGNTAAPQFDRCVFENSGCHANGWGGVLVPEDQSTGAWRNCVFRNNTCNYGSAVDDGGTASPVFHDCVFEANYGRSMGGAYYGFGGSSATFERCRFVGNRIAKGGNGQDYYLSSSSAPVFRNCDFDAGPNPVVVADGASGAAKDNAVLTLVGCSVRGYRAAYGTVHLSVTATGTIDSSVFTDNKCVRGGAIGTERSIVVRNCTFRDNEANEGGAIAIYSMSNAMQVVRIEDSIFEDNTAKTTGGAIRAVGPVVVEIVRTRLVNNHALGQGGGAVYSGPDVGVVLNQSIFEANTSPLGAAVSSNGISLVAVDSVFRANALLVTTADTLDDSCGVVDGRTGGAVFVSRTDVLLTETEAPTTSATCAMDDLRLVRLTFDGNTAIDGGGGALFVDGRLPNCIVEPTQLCVDCVYSNNVAAYGTDVATAVDRLELVTTDQVPWMLMTPRDMVIGAMDRFGHRLAGSHAPIVVRIALTSATSTVSPVRLVANNSRVLRSGVVTFKSVTMQIPPSSITNTVDRAINLTFSSETRGVTGEPIALTLSITVLKCPQTTGLLSPEGGCLVEATDSKRELIASVIVAVIAGVALGFVIYWSYRHSDRVLETIHAFVTGVGGVVVRFAFEIVDVVSDVQALVDLFRYDLTIAQPTVIRTIYVVLFAMAVFPALSVLRWSVYSIRAQWKRLVARRVIFAARGNCTQSQQLALRLLASRPSASPDASSLSWVTLVRGATWRATDLLQSMRTTRKHQVHAANSVQNIAILPSATPLPTVRNVYDTAATSRFLDEQEKLLLVELEYQHVRANYMKRALARLVTQDGLLLILNLYIYAANHGAESFAKSRFRVSLEVSIVLSVLHFGSQVQNITTWMQLNKVAEIVDQLEKIRALRVAAATDKLPKGE